MQHTVLAATFLSNQKMQKWSYSVSFNCSFYSYNNIAHAKVRS